MRDPEGQDWSPETYARFRGLRLRPAIDLLNAVPPLPPGEVIDLGCGNGAVGAALSARLRRPVTGIDRSPAMLEAARGTGAYARLIEADALGWTPEGPVALIFSNALCHWLPDHDTLFGRFAGILAPGGTLAVQMPHQYDAPSHALLREIAQRLFPDRFDFTGWTAPVAPPETYLAMLGRLGAADVWETSYLQRLGPAGDGHPVRAFTASTAMRPFLDKLDTAETERFVADYDAALARAYPPAPDGGAIFPFRRLFFTLTVPA